MKNTILFIAAFPILLCIMALYLVLWPLIWMMSEEIYEVV